MTNLDKAAILLRKLPSPSLAQVLEALGSENSSRLRVAIDAVSRRPNLSELEVQVLREFREMQREVRESLRGSPALESMHSNSTDSSVSETPSEIAANQNTDAKPQIETAPDSEATDPVEDLLNTPPEILAIALQRETPRAMSLVMRELPTEFISKVLEKLPAETRQQVFMFLAIKSTVHPSVIKSVMQAVARVCKSIDPTEVGQQDSRFKTLIGILQMVEREERLRLMEALTEQDEELANQIDENLYDYADIMRIQDRSVQKLLTQLEQKVVALALKTAPGEIIEKVMKNLSERVRASLNEEIELISVASPSKVDQARREIANVIKAQDKEGTLLWIE